MKYLLILDLTLTALGAAMSLSIGYVALVFVLYRNTSARMQDGLPGVLVITGSFVALFLLAGIASLMLRRRARWHWAAQAVLFVALPILWHITFSHFRNQ